MHGGKVTARSEKGKGSTFTITLPPACTAGADVAPAAPAPNGHPAAAPAGP
jgi:hypothetical protein